ncbi:MAG: hypothetical protein WCE23_05630 [Candidatus Binatus sp.]
MKRDVTGRSKSIPQLADKLIRQLQGVTVAEAKDALDYAASFLDRTQIVQAGKRLSTPPWLDAKPLSTTSRKLREQRPHPHC